MNCPNRFQFHLGIQIPQPVSDENCLGPVVPRQPVFNLNLNLLAPTLTANSLPRTDTFTLAPSQVANFFRIPENAWRQMPAFTLARPNRNNPPQIQVPQGETPGWAQVMMGVLNLMNSADIRIRVPTNAEVDSEGNIVSREASCRYREFVPVNQCDPGFRSSCFERNAYTDVIIPIRTTSDTHETIVAGVLFAFSQPARILAGGTPPLSNLRVIPGNAVAINTLGFRAIPPFRAGGDAAQRLAQIQMNPSGTTRIEDGSVVALGQQMPRPSYNYYDLQYFFQSGQPNVRDFLLRDLRTNQARSLLDSNELSETLLNFRVPLEAGGAPSAPLDQLVGGMAPGVEGSLITGFIESFGLNHISLYPRGIPVGGLPVSVRSFVDLISPLFNAESRRFLYSQAATYNPNTDRNMHCVDPQRYNSSQMEDLKFRRPLFSWGNLTEASMESLFNAGTLNFPDGSGFIRFSSRDEVIRWNQQNPDPRVRQWIEQHPFNQVNRLSFQMNDQHVRLRVNGFAVDEFNMNIVLQQGNDPVSLHMEHVTADAFDLELPSMDDMRALDWNFEEILKRSQVHLHGLRVGNMRLGNPQFHVNFNLQNAYFNHFWTSTQRVGQGTSLTFHQDLGEVESVDIAATGLGRITTRNARLENMHYTQAPDRATSGMGRVTWAGNLAFVQDNVDVQMQGGSTLENLNFAVSLENNRMGDATVDFDVSGEASSGRIHLQPLNLDLRELSIRRGHFSGTSRLRPGSEERDYTAHLRGEVALRFDSHFRTNLNIPGFSLEGDFENVLLSGGADIQFNLGQNYSWSVDQWAGSTEPLSFEGSLRNAVVIQDPSEVDAELRQIPFHEVVRTQTRINTHLRIAEVRHWASVPIRSTPDENSLARSANRLELDMSGIQASDIEGTGEVWAALPLFGYMRAIMGMGNQVHLQRQNSRPRVNMPRTVLCSALPSGTPPSIPLGTNREAGNYIYLGRWQTGVQAGVSEISDVRSCVIGQPIDLSHSNPYLATEIPIMRISRQRPFVDTHDSRLFVEAAWPDNQRGGWLYYSSEHRRPQLPANFPAWARPGR